MLIRFSLNSCHFDLAQDNWLLEKMQRLMMYHYQKVTTIFESVVNN